MSYSILITLKGRENPNQKELPFATSKIFEQYYLPLIKKTNFKILPFLEFGYSLPKEEFYELIAEIGILKGKVEPENSFIIERLEFLETELKKIRFETIDDIFIG